LNTLHAWLKTSISIGASSLRNLIALAWLTLAFLSASHAQTYPTKPIKLVVPFGAGGVADLTARIIAQKITSGLGQPVVIDNRPGAGGVVAADVVAKAEPDGHTLLLISNGNAVSAGLMKTLPFDPVNDFASVALFATFDIAILVSQESKFNTLQEALHFAKANPGVLNVGSINIGSTQNLTAELFKSVSNLDVQVVPFNGTPALMTALKGGQVDLAVEILGPVLPQVKAHNFKLLAITSEQRALFMQEVPTAKELGLTNLVAASWNGLAAPAKTPKAIVDRLNKEVELALDDAATQKKLSDMYLSVKHSTPQQAQEWYLNEIKTWTRVIQKSGIAKQ
jgi:tripartite-type tricarboxylate transporter receptor subunit TctC